MNGNRAESATVGGAARVASMVGTLTAVGSPGDVALPVDVEVEVARQLLDELTQLERLSAAAAAAQARVTVEFARVHERLEVARRERATLLAQASGGDGFTVWRARNGRIDTGPSAGAQVALARRLSPAQGARALAFAQTLVVQMPATLAALTDGTLSSRRAETLVRETSHLSVEHRATVDAEVAGDPLVGSWGDREVERRAMAAAYRIDPQGAVERARQAHEGRRVSLRPVPDTMCRLSGLLPVAQGVAVYASLRRDADSARAAGDLRTQGQLMADRLVELVTGQAVATGTLVEVQVVISDAALLGVGDGAQDPGQLSGYGTVPAGWVRDLLTGADRPRVWLRRLYASPDQSQLVAMEADRRLFTGGLRRFLIARDGTCRTPWCDAPIPHLDHVIDAARGGPTSEANGQGLCVRCNHTKQHPGWHVETLTERDGPHRVQWRTPTGLAYDSLAPPLLPGATPRPQVQEYEPASPIEIASEAFLHAA